MDRLDVLSAYLGLPRDQIEGMTREQIRQARDDTAADLDARVRCRELHTTPISEKRDD